MPGGYCGIEKNVRMLRCLIFFLMTSRKINPGETRWVELGNGTTFCGFHVKLERRWETIEFKLTAGSAQAQYSRTTGLIKNDPNQSPILVIDGGFVDSRLKEIL